MKTIPLTKGKIALVDDEDYPRIAAHSWYASLIGKRWYASRDAGGTKARVHIYMHREIMDAQIGEEIDHREYTDTLNNQKSNLRIATRSQNGVNRPSKNIFRGVCYKPARNKTNPWTSAITVNFQTIHLGYHPTPERAAIAYNAAAIRYFGEFARLNNVEMG